MNFIKTYFPSLLLILFIVGCEGETDPGPQAELPKLSIQESRAFERDGNSTMVFEVRTSKTWEEDITVDYAVEGKTAEPGADFTATSGTLTIPAGSLNASFSVEVLDDTDKEVDEKILATLSAPQQAEISGMSAEGVIEDNDRAEFTAADGGYETSNTHFGYQLVWDEEFDGSELNPDHYNFELEDGCPNLCGWGNMELQWYTDLSKNIKLEDGKLIITATKTGAANFNSARIQTKGKKEFRFGRIDVRAKMPKGQGIWPAIWMLGSNIDEVGWPACGEIDIMELVGHQPRSSHGTAHWGAQGDLNSTSSTSVYTIAEDFADNFHVFSIVWESGEIVWYVDETRFHSVTTNDMRGKPYPFNQEMFFIMNVAVGGQWPGSPDETTVFPQTMEVDYLRVFQ
ncbi:MAG: family 16 glycosylhydrolase [Bacteroidota bacterium]